MSKQYLGMKIKELVSVPDKKSVFDYYVSRINKYNDKLNAFLEISSPSNEISGVLGGIPYALKDNMLAKGTHTTCSSKILKNYDSPYDSTVARKLGNSGAVLMGKTNLDEFAMGSSTENSAFVVSKNPWDLSRIPGGSSGGSAVAVAAGLVPFALGSDTGGSIRQPAALCGVVGYKPTYGLVSRFGLVAFSSSLDQIGPFTRCVDDAYEVIKVISGQDANDATTMANPLDFNRELSGELRGKKLAIPQEMLEYEGLEAGIHDSFLETIEKLREAGVTVDVVSIPSLKYVVATYYLIAPGEASSNLSRYDGVRYGWRAGESNYDSMINSDRDGGFGKEVKRRILLGTFTLSSAYYDAYYNKALKARKMISDELNKVLEDYDFIVNPSSPITAPKIGEISDPLTYYLMDVFTIPANLAGIPGISIPISPTNGLPVGLQLMGKRFEDVSLLSFAKGVEKLSSAYSNGLTKLPEGWEE